MLYRKSFRISFIFKMFCISCTLYLVTLEVNTFFVTKPTSSNKERKPIEEQFVPEVIVCVEPAFQEEMTLTFGYASSWHYNLGLSEMYEFIGWNSLDFGENSSKILEEILTVKKNSTIVTAELIISNNSYKTESATIQQTQMNPIYPFGRCAKILPDKKHGHLDSLFINPSEEFENIAIYFHDPLNSPDYFLLSTSMSGDQVKTTKGMFGKYRTEVSQSVFVDSGCEEYSEGNTYNSCVRKEINRKLIDILGCVPPLLVFENGNEVCNEVFNISKEKTQEVETIFFSFYSSNSPTKCRVPCTKGRNH